MDNTIIISDKNMEEKWFKCKRSGLYAIWIGPQTERSKMMKWLKSMDANQVSISSLSHSLIYINCKDVKFRTDFLKREL